ncbi:hypothetical protein [Lacihabitans soyangensis]|uniref:Uncharacterized protein n=1 Tax=Lacihabitans soyangensis TaxID=869394 RepID=A0AAE3H561_9BACT|nr:hypothetical protein [Lacihabitans soyangensis]MCP9764958.1 hypothetical protein [Lacihabitans soyangensis]
MSELTTPSPSLGRRGIDEGNEHEVEYIQTELLDDNLAAFLLAGGVDVKGLMTLLNEFLDFSSPSPSPGRNVGPPSPIGSGELVCHFSKIFVE